MQNRVTKAKPLNDSRKVKWLFEAPQGDPSFELIMETRGELQGNSWTLDQYKTFRKQVEQSELTLGEWLAKEQQR
jgi:hypothetical protein